MMSVETTTSFNVLEDKKLGEVEVYEFKKSIKRYQICKYGLYISLVFFLYYPSQYFRQLNGLVSFCSPWP